MLEWPPTGSGDAALYVYCGSLSDVWLHEEILDNLEAEQLSLLRCRGEPWLRVCRRKTSPATCLSADRTKKATQRAASFA